MKTFDQLTQDQQMAAVDRAMYSLATDLIKGKIILNLLPHDNHIYTALSVLGRGVSPEQFLEYLHTIPKVKIAVLHESGRMVKKATYSDDGLMEISNENRTATV
jgi:hypothetical protein